MTTKLYDTTTIGGKVATVEHIHDEPNTGLLRFHYNDWTFTVPVAVWEALIDDQHVGEVDLAALRLVDIEMLRETCSGAAEALREYSTPAEIRCREVARVLDAVVTACTGKD